MVHLEMVNKIAETIPVIASNSQIALHNERTSFNEWKCSKKYNSRRRLIWLLLLSFNIRSLNANNTKLKVLMKSLKSGTTQLH